MRNPIIPIVIMVLFIFIARSSAQQIEMMTQAQTSTLTAEQQSLITQHTSAFPGNTQLSLAIINGDTEIFAGVIRQDGDLQHIDNRDSIFEIGSITKVFTSTLLAQGIVNNDLSPNTEIADLLGYPLKDSLQITLQQLSNHTSGLMRMPSNMMFAQMKDPDNPYLYYDSTLLRGWITEYMPSDLDQKTSEYSNLGAALLGYGISRYHQKSLESLMQEGIFAPLHMDHTTMDRSAVSKYLVSGLGPDGDYTSNWDFDVLEGAGALKSSVHDLAKYAQAVISDEDEALRLQRQPTFKVNEQMDMGLGWHIINGKSGRTLYWHNGGTGGYTSSMLIDVENKKAIIILSNVSAFHPQMGEIDGLAFDLMRGL